jgi:hypothetical protein
MTLRKHTIESARLPEDFVLSPGHGGVTQVERLLPAMGHTNSLFRCY